MTRSKSSADVAAKVATGPTIPALATTTSIQLAVHIVENAMLNGEVIRLDGAIRMAPR